MEKRYPPWSDFVFHGVIRPLEVVYVMDHEVITCSSKASDWMLSLSHVYFSLHHVKNNVTMIMELEVPKRPNFKRALSTVMVQQVLQRDKQKRFSRCKCQETTVEKCRFI